MLARICIKRQETYAKAENAKLQDQCIRQKQQHSQCISSARAHMELPEDLLKDELIKEEVKFCLESLKSKGIIRKWGKDFQISATQL